MDPGLKEGCVGVMVEMRKKVFTPTSVHPLIYVRAHSACITSATLQATSGLTSSNNT